MDINEDVVINGNVTISGSLVATSLLTNEDVVCGRNYRFDQQEGILIDNDSNARFSGVSTANLALCGVTPSIPDATTPADAVTKLNQLLELLRLAGTVGPAS